MPPTSKFMMGLGALLIFCGVVGWLWPSPVSSEAPLTGMIAAGLAMLAAGGAAGQGRRSLRRTGYFIGIFLPVLYLAFFGWRASGAWLNWKERQSGLLHPILFTVAAAASLLTILVLMKLRAGDNIAERGYSILPITNPAPTEPSPEEVKRREC